MKESITDLKNFLPIQRYMQVKTREYTAKLVKEEDFKKNCTFTPDTKLTKGKSRPTQPRERLIGGRINQTKMNQIGKVQITLDIKRKSDASASKNEFKK